MEFKRFSVEGLFGLYNHIIDFAEHHAQSEKASIIMLYGENGIDKTTVLKLKV